MTRINRDTIAYLVVIGFSMAMLVWAIPAYTPPYPGYGASAALVPIVSVAVMLFMACLSLLRVALAKYSNKSIAEEEAEFPEDMQGDGFTQVGRVNMKLLASIMLPSVLLVVVIEYIGYMLASFGFLIVLQYAVGSRKWTQIVVLALVLTLVLYVVMRYGFGVPVPGPQVLL